MKSQERTAQLIRNLVVHIMRTGKTQEQAMRQIYEDLKDHDSSITEPFIHWAVTGRYLIGMENQC